jgi:hypothetical protein
MDEETSVGGLTWDSKMLAPRADRKSVDAMCSEVR